jgi:hypothetical protein
VADGDRRLSRRDHRRIRNNTRPCTIDSSVQPAAFAPESLWLTILPHPVLAHRVPQFSSGLLVPGDNSQVQSAKIFVLWRVLSNETMVYK